MYYDELAPKTRHLHQPRLPINRNPSLHILPLALHQDKDAARLPSYLFCPYALRFLH